MPFPDDDLALPQGALVLVTGVTGFLASVVADELVKSGNRMGFHPQYPGVRGTARDPASEKAAWMPDYFVETYGAGKFEVVCVEDLAAEGCLDEVVKGCDAVAHLASNLSMSPDPNIVVTDAVAFTRNALEAAIKEPQIKRFVFCSSSSAVQQHRWNEPYDLTPSMWNTHDPSIAWTPPFTPDNIMATYNASNVAAEHYFWSFLEERKPHFTGNAVLPDLVFGLPLNPAKQGLGPAGAALQSLWDHEDMYKIFYPQYGVGAKDTALLHVAGLVKGDVKGERLFAYGWPKRWTDVIPVLQGMYPEHRFPEPPENEGADLANVTARPRAEEILKWFGESGWTSREDCLKTVCDVVRDGTSFVTHKQA